MSRDLAPLLQRIRTLLEQRGADPTMPLLTAMEHTLTDGYARALLPATPSVTRPVRTVA